MFKQATIIHLCAMSASILGAAQQVQALDLTVSSIEVTQAVQFGTTVLIGGNVTWVRAKIGTGGVAFSGVDASLRLTICGVQQPLPPIFSLNWPVTSPAPPQSANVNDNI